ncbi:MAG: GNAT family N-acetyltransferase [Xanthomonadales bacterium]|nr:GNAT family N-acetyltransferase [Xanthomonadales bacterium]NIX11560.1 GNAT family N-acetyltransferase [Xanthomonadales bacterium]
MHRVRVSVRENMLSDPSVITEAMTAEALTETGRGWVAVEGDALLGFCIAMLGNRSIWALFVDPDREGEGVGGRLLDTAVRWLRDQGPGAVRLSTDPGTRAEAFYCARGWRATGMLDNGEVAFVLDGD